MPTATAYRAHQRVRWIVLLGTLALLASGCTTPSPPVVSAGDVLWTRQFGTSGTDVATGGVAVDALGRAYVAGRTSGALDGPNAGDTDAFVRSYAADGTLRWGRQFGTAAGDEVGQVAVDAAGNVYVVGGTDGDLEGVALGVGDAFVRAFDEAGTVRWTRQFGSPANDVAAAAAVAAGRLAVAGYTLGDVGGPNAGSYDGFVRVFQP